MYPGLAFQLRLQAFKINVVAPKSGVPGLQDMISRPVMACPRLVDVNTACKHI